MAGDDEAGGNDDDIALAHINKHAASKKVAYENVLWALVNSKEFVFNK